jgi:hypothetical protein
MARVEWVSRARRWGDKPMKRGTVTAALGVRDNRICTVTERMWPRQILSVQVL